MNWVADLKHHTQEMHQEMLLFCQDYPVQYASEEKILKTLIRYVDRFAAWARVLPDPQDVNVWQWMDWRRVSYSARAWLTTLEGYFDILPFVKEKESQVKRSQPRSACEETILKHINLIEEAYNQGHSPFKWSDEVETQRLPAYTILALLWPYVYPQYLDHSLRLNAFEMQHWPAVMYHPCDTQALLESIVISLIPNDRNILITPKKTGLHFEICITHATVSMTPVLWEIIHSSLDARNPIERLREIGGMIDPLTWDEGQGQGVIVRLPWAT